MTYKIGAVRYPWSNLIKEGTTFSVYNGRLLNMKPYLNGNEKIFGNEVHEQILNGLGKDITYRFSTSDRLSNAVACMDELYAVGSIDQNTPGCIANKIILYMSLIVILGVVMTRFFMAIVFNWFLSWKLGKVEADREEYMQAMSLRNSSPANQVRPSLRSSTPSFNLVSSKENIHAMNRSSFLLFNSTSESTSGNLGLTSQLKENTKMPLELRQYHTLILVTCYSEGLDSMKETLNSIASTTYPDQYKLLFIVADGLITGSGNSQSTPDIVLSLMTDEIDMGPVLPQSYVAIADGAKRHNMAKVRIGYYVVDKHRVPMIVVIKCGTEEEKTTAKPGNRGKRDSQIILMDFFSKILFDDRLSPLQIDLFIKISVLAKVHPSNFEICLMVDADTKVDPESLSKMVTCMAQDPTIMGLCGETRIENKSQTWVTRIQVFEYYISHHLGKAFESVFGGVTCLPGCFCMYRLKAPRPDGSYVPIICSPNIIQQYSENVVDTLHKKNLLSLGEDRYLTTLMLRAFPKRKMVFVPKALCHTVVPHTLKMLLSQRRRWINSTIHNLLELLLVPQLCGTFCFSMQFVVFLELIGTVTLPAAISLTLFLLVSTFLGDVQWVPLVLLFCILGLPAILILLTTREIIYIYWMLTYLLALPVWNFLLPAYAFWHFDDFSWGQTRKVEGEAQGGDHSKKEGEFDSSVLQLKSLEDFFKESNNI
ncbi:hypothetical protein HMI55_006147 [Coelomomyces lativittatus]|nr:hypothetical protein HMI55_006147 [Coelomomyces lativittatus]